MNFNLARAQQFFLVLLLALSSLALVIGISFGVSMYGSQQSASCNVADIKLYGGLVYYPGEGLDASSTFGDQTASEDIRQQIEAADADPGIKAILMQVDSGGGDPVAGEDVATALKHASKPTVALVADIGASAAYWAATGAQTIFASANSSLVDIGVTQSYLDQSMQNAQTGLTFVSLIAGKYKDMGNPDVPLTPDERALFQRDLDITFQNFIDTVAKNRNLSVSSVTAIADGSSMLGAMALKDGLIDQIGNIYDAQDFIAKKIGTDAVLCQ